MLRYSRDIPDPGNALYVNGQPSPGRLAFSAYSNLLSGYQEIATANGTTLLLNPRALPRAFVVYDVTTGTDDAFYARLDDGSLDPGSSAIVANLVPSTFDRADGREVPGHDAVVTVAASATDITLQALLARPGLLVVTNAWFPGWTASVDGTQQAVERVDAVFQGVYLREGSHRVRLVFEPMSVRLGLIAASLALLFSAFLVIWDRRLDAG